ncbi:hypothetical protein Ais01nite_79100 [Asanoa ishikariensis]|uniref:Uncharacterized protein n=1 Tax=Asanoa ishikariensis TaxID=137265 RepID=A0A1H3KI22_9ACTN|nr:hypothetical protein [Asanoa ishikariensis]GIF69875.1 hypothetical protein Ais01nite_79100 [Asanoa ishikariensis]SDY51766.1 hypothetical protein SAMN05421684_0156 [Asanoa ishikariensis]
MHAIRRRTVASVVAAFFVAAPLAVGGAAFADPAQETNSQVTFSGDGLLGVACGAKPSAASVTVPAESTLRVVNNTGRKAKLLLDGATRGEVASGATADVLFHRGPVELALKPDCMLADEKSVRVEVMAPPPPAATGNDTPANPPTLPFGNGGTSSGGDDQNAGGDNPGDQNQRPGANGENPDPAAAASPGAVDPNNPDADPAKPANPDDPANADAAALAVDSFANPGGGTGLDGATTVAGAAAEPLASVDPVSDSGPTGLLALIATVCLVGVSAGAIRAIVAQRASRTRAA